MILRSIVVGPIQANCYIAGCEKTGRGVVIDPGAEPERVLQALKELGLSVSLVLNTHGHVDHIGANDAVKRNTSAVVCIHQADAAMLPDPAKNLSSMMVERVACEPADRLLSDGDELRVGDLMFKVIHTPGHTPGSVCFLCQDVLFSGDTLFNMSVGRHDFPGGSAQDLARSIRERLFVLPDDTTVLPGHGSSTNIGREKRSNPFVGQNARFRLC